MPVCKGCEKPFPHRIRVDGVEKVLSNRKYCLECSPFGKPRRKEPKGSSKEPLVGKQVECCTCNRIYVVDYKKGHTSTKCNSCMVNLRRFKLKEKAIEYKGGGCHNCGYSKCKRALIFHHVLDESKEFSFSGNHSRSWAVLQKELDKCILLCANCHAEEHERLEVR